MPKDDLRPLPDDIVAPLLQALVTVRPTPENRLYLHSAATTDARLAGDAASDYNVLYRGRSVASGAASMRRQSTATAHGTGACGQTATRCLMMTGGHCTTLVEAMEHFRMAWGRIHAKEGFKRERG
jgi:hypothetical protein